MPIVEKVERLEESGAGPALPVIRLRLTYDTGEAVTVTLTPAAADALLEQLRASLEKRRGAGAEER
jgi:hypothetical protein